MGSSPEEFAELRRLLALKRAEQPPPGYFNTFAGKVVARIEAEGLAAAPPWWTRWLVPATWTPGIAGANTAIFTGLAMLGGAAWYFKSRPASATRAEMVGRVPAVPTPRQTTPGWVANEEPTQLAGIIPQPFARPYNPPGNPAQIPPVVPFQIRQPSIHDRMRPTESATVPAGIFDPWATGRALPTNIVHYVELPAH